MCLFLFWISPIKVCERTLLRPAHRLFRIFNSEFEYLSEVTVIKCCNEPSIFICFSGDQLHGSILIGRKPRDQALLKGVQILVLIGDRAKRQLNRKTFLKAKTVLKRCEYLRGITKKESNKRVLSKERRYLPNYYIIRLKGKHGQCHQTKLVVKTKILGFTKREEEKRKK